MYGEQPCDLDHSSPPLACYNGGITNKKESKMRLKSRNYNRVWLKGEILTFTEASLKLGESENYVIDLLSSNKNPHFPSLVFLEKAN